MLIQDLLNGALNNWAQMLNHLQNQQNGFLLKTGIVKIVCLIEKTQHWCSVEKCGALLNYNMDIFIF